MRWPRCESAPISSSDWGMTMRRSGPGSTTDRAEFRCPGNLVVPRSVDRRIQPWRPPVAGGYRAGAAGAPPAATAWSSGMADDLLHLRRLPAPAGLAQAHPDHVEPDSPGYPGARTCAPRTVKSLPTLTICADGAGARRSCCLEMGRDRNGLERLAGQSPRHAGAGRRVRARRRRAGAVAGDPGAGAGETTAPHRHSFWHRTSSGQAGRRSAWGLVRAAGGQRGRRGIRAGMVSA